MENSDAWHRGRMTGLMRRISDDSQAMTAEITRLVRESLDVLLPNMWVVLVDEFDAVTSLRIKRYVYSLYPTRDEAQRVVEMSAFVYNGQSVYFASAEKFDPRAFKHYMTVIPGSPRLYARAPDLPPEQDFLSSRYIRHVYSP